MTLTHEELRELQETFAYNDLDKDGRISLDEFANMLSELESGAGMAEAKVGFHEIDTDKDGAIELDEFIDWWRDQ
jgi:Ca2+-binding EF-hand superfamily protein